MPMDCYNTKKSYYGGFKREKKLSLETYLLILQFATFDPEQL